MEKESPNVRFFINSIRLRRSGGHFVKNGRTQYQSFIVDTGASILHSRGEAVSDLFASLFDCNRPPPPPRLLLLGCPAVIGGRRNVVLLESVAVDNLRKREIRFDF